MNDLSPFEPLVVPGSMLTGLIAMVLCESFIRRGVEPPSFALAVARRFQLERSTIDAVKWQETIEMLVAKFCEPLPTRRNSPRPLN
jgi:hypothetical protein